VELRGVDSIEVVSGLHTIAARFDKKVSQMVSRLSSVLPAVRDAASAPRCRDKVYATNRAHVASVEMKLPTVSEQTAIAAALSDMDAELAVLKARRDKTCDLKQAMMQELLTGRTRLVAPAQQKEGPCSTVSLGSS